ncbi:MAG: hypothetical protein GY762_11810 [Proteobacteria bacterium]|nr:hypothetical protein [Pseudomonadota bacterium]
MVSDYENGTLLEAVAILSAGKDAGWYYIGRRYPRCFVRGEELAVLYLGEDVDRFVETFTAVGDIELAISDTEGDMQVFVRKMEAESIQETEAVDGDPEQMRLL